MKSIATIGTVVAVGPTSVTIEVEYSHGQSPQRIEIAAEPHEQREWSALLHQDRAATVMLIMSKPSPTWGIDLASATDAQLRAELERRMPKVRK